MIKVTSYKKEKGFVIFNFLMEGEYKTLNIPNVVISDLNVLLGIKKPSEIVKKYIELEDVILANITPQH